MKYKNGNKLNLAFKNILCCCGRNVTKNGCKNLNQHEIRYVEGY